MLNVQPGTLYWPSVSLLTQHYLLLTIVMRTQRLPNAYTFHDEWCCSYTINNQTCGFNFFMFTGKK